MSAIPFDTLKLARGLEAAGLTPEQAAGSSAALAEALAGAKLATRTDLVLLEQRLTVRIGTMLVAAIGVLTAVIHFLR